MGLMFRPAENETIDVRVLFNSLKAKFSNYTSFSPTDKQLRHLGI